MTVASDRGQLLRALGDQPQRVLLAGAREQLVADLRGGLQPLLAQPALFEEVRIVHGDACRRRARPRPARRPR